MNRVFDEDETFERELFAVRAGAIATPRLDVDDVFARAHRIQGRVSGERSILSAWIGAAACAAACVLAIPVQTQNLAPAPRADVYAEGDGLACRIRSASGPLASLAPSETSICPMTPSELVCGRDVTFSTARP